MEEESNVVIVLESDLIEDVLGLDLEDPENKGVVRNMLMLMLVMLARKNEKGIYQMTSFDVVKACTNILGSKEDDVSYLAMACLALLNSMELGGKPEGYGIL